MTRAELCTYARRVWESDLLPLLDRAQIEYAAEDDAFANFRQYSERSGVDVAQCLMICLEKHLCGIYSHLGGYTSQREPVAGRIGDAILYLLLLRALLEERGP